MGLAVAIQADHLVADEPRPCGVMRRNGLEFLSALVAVQAVLIVKTHASHKGFLVRVRGITREVAITRHLRFQIPAEAVIAVAVVALTFCDPFIFEMARGQRAAIGISQVVNHGEHHMAAPAPAHFVHAFEGVIVRDEYRASGHDDQRCEGRQLGGGFRGQARDPKRNGRSFAKLAESDTSRANAKYDPEDAEKRAEEIDKLEIADVHIATFRTDTAVTLNSGSFEVGSKLSATARLINSFAS